MFSTVDMAQSQTPNLYQDVRLLKNSSIRLLTIHPQESEDETLCFTLEAVALDDKPEYIALSYTWGTPTPQAAEKGMTDERRFPITCNGQELQITENLLHFLRHMVEDDGGLKSKLWIDAICIDQGNIQERNEQILMMKKIYAEARAVIVWLGEDDEYTIPALDLIQTLGSMEHDKIRQLDPFKEMNRVESDSNCIVDENSFIAWSQLLQRSWFSRIWVLQEHAHARQVFFMCGSYPIDHEKLVRVLEYSRWSHYPRFCDTKTARAVDEAIIAFKIGNWLRKGDSVGLTGAIVLTRSFKCSDPRDKVFALLGFYNECDEFLPDYTKSVEEVCTEATKFQLRYSEDLSALSLVEDRRYRQLTSLPSWVPDYSVRTLDSIGIVKQGVFHASQNLQTKLIFKDSGILALRAMKIDDMTCIGEYKLEWEEDWVNPRWLSILGGLDDMYCTGEHKLEAFWRTLIENTDRWDHTEEQLNFTHPAPSSMARSFRCSILVRVSWAIMDAGASPLSEQLVASIFTSLNTLSAMDPHNLIPTPDSVHRFVEKESSFPPSELLTDTHLATLPPEFTPYPEALRSVKEAKFFRTRKGFMGTGPLSMREGDSVWLFPGAQVFFILREKLGTDRFELIGDAYVHGLMHGEACKDVERRLKVIELV